MAVKAQDYFAVVPEWVLYADISSNAVRLYAALRRFADKQGKAHPSRATLAELCRFSVPSVKRAMEELIAIGAVMRSDRFDEAGRRTSNSYTVMTQARVTGEPTGRVTGEPEARVTGEPETIASNEPEPYEPEKDSAFDQFWKVYPRKVAKGAARKAWVAAIKKADPDTIITAAALFSRTVVNTDPKFTAHPATWLNAEQWEDEEPEPASSGLAYYEPFEAPPPPDPAELAAFAEAAKANPWKKPA